MFFLFPVATSEPVQRRPIVTIALVAVCVAVHLAFPLRILLVEGPDAHDAFLGRWGYRAADHSTLTVFTGMFLHSGLLQLFGNMWFLLLFGRIVEDRLGRGGFLLSYLLCGFCAMMIQGHFYSGSERLMPTIGASGAVSGVMGMLLVYAFWAEFRFLWFMFFLIYIRGGSTKLITLWVCLFYVGFDALSAWVAHSIGRGTYGGVAVFAHVGGFLTGLAIALAVKHGLSRLMPGQREDGDQDLTLRPSRIGILRRASAETRAAGRIERSLQSGDTVRAIGAYLQAVSRFPEINLPPDEMCELADLLAAKREREHARRIYERTARRTIGPARHRALLGLARVCADDPSQHSRGARAARELLALDPPPDVARQADRLLMRLGQAQEEDEGKSPLHQNLQRRAAHSATDRPAYIPDSAPRGEEQRSPPRNEQERIFAQSRTNLPPSSPAYIPDAQARGPSGPTHAVVLTEHRRLDVPLLARLIGSVTGQSMVKMGAAISQGMGVLLETDSEETAREVVERLESQGVRAAAVPLERLPREWEEFQFTGADITGTRVTFELIGGAEVAEDLGEIAVLAHARVARTASDGQPPLVCEIRTLIHPRVLRANEAVFSQRAPEQPRTIADFALLLGQRATQATCDAGILRSLRGEGRTCLRFSSGAQFGAYVRWLTLCAVAGHR